MVVDDEEEDDGEALVFLLRKNSGFELGGDSKRTRVEAKEKLQQLAATMKQDLESSGRRGEKFHGNERPNRLGFDKFFIMASGDPTFMAKSLKSQVVVASLMAERCSSHVTKLAYEIKILKKKLKHHQYLQQQAKTDVEEAKVAIVKAESYIEELEEKNALM
uniref:Uncharacterized protein n=1 Tax=Cannabis sativa TaxID=3483 RepID=A0A803Q2N8_CANSA